MRGPHAGRQRHRGWFGSHRTARGQQRPEKTLLHPLFPPTYNHPSTQPSLQPCIPRLKQQLLWLARLQALPCWIYASPLFPGCCLCSILWFPGTVFLFLSAEVPLLLWEAVSVRVQHKVQTLGDVGKYSNRQHIDRNFAFAHIN